MTSRHTSSPLTKANAILSVIATIVYIIGFACPYWLVKDYTLSALPPDQPDDLHIDSNIGLLTSCKAETNLGTQNRTSTETCSSVDQAIGWRKMAAGLAIPALVLAVASCVLSVLNAVVERLDRMHVLKLLIAVIVFSVAGFIIAVLVIFHEYKHIRVSPRHRQWEDYELGWAYLLTMADAPFFIIVGLSTVLDYVGTQFRAKTKTTKHDDKGGASRGTDERKRRRRRRQRRQRQQRLQEMY